MIEPDEEPTFTVEEANAALPDLRERVARIRSARQEILAASGRIGKRVAADGGGHDGREYWEALAVLKAEVEHLSARGIVLRDPESGLLDFPAELSGRRVFLCWRLGEDHVGYWHEVDAGFLGRRPL